MINEEEIVDIDKEFERDINYINNEIIAEQVNGNFCKWSRTLNTLAYSNITFEQYTKYWRSRYSKKPIYSKQIEQACINKLTSGLTDVDVMVNMIVKSKDYLKEKTTAIEFLLGKEKAKPIVKSLEGLVSTKVTKADMLKAEQEEADSEETDLLDSEILDEVEENE